MSYVRVYERARHDCVGWQTKKEKDKGVEQEMCLREKESVCEKKTRRLGGGGMTHVWMSPITFMNDSCLNDS